MEKVVEVIGSKPEWHQATVFPIVDLVAAQTLLHK